MRHVWACRKAALPLLLRRAGLQAGGVRRRRGGRSGRLAEFVERFRKILGSATAPRSVLRPRLGRLPAHPADARSGRSRRPGASSKISREVCDLVIEFGGAMSGEHGDGLACSYLNERLFGPRLYAAFQQIKAAFDPAGN